MERILILIAADDFADAQSALLSARNASKAPEALSFGLSLTAEPTDEEMQEMQQLGLVQYLCPGPDVWSAMPHLWQGEDFVLLAHPAMRFAAGWDAEIIAALRSACPADSLLTFALTGYLPVREDPLDSVCPVAADCFDEEGRLHFRHGTPLRFVAAPQPCMFLHPDFCFAPAGFFRALQTEGSVDPEEPLFIRALREGWKLLTLNKPLIRLLWDLPVSPAALPAGHEMHEAFLELSGVSFAGRTLSPQSRRGAVDAELPLQLKVPLPVVTREKVRSWQQYWLERMKKDDRKISPKCVTLYTRAMAEDPLRWLRHLAGLKNLPLLCYVEPLQLREIAEFIPDVHEYRPRYGMELADQEPEALLPLSKASLLATARDRYLTHSHYVWLDADCVQYPVYDRTVFDWSRLCTDRIVLSTVNTVPDPSMVVVPEALVLPLAQEMTARAQWWLDRRGTLPTETELWQLVVRENPDWFQLQPLPVARQLFTLLHEADV